MYLRDTESAAAMHNEALHKLHKDIQLMLDASTLPDEVSYNASEAVDMGDYIDLE